MEATYELTLRVFTFRDACEERARQSEGKTFRKVSDAELKELTNEATAPCSASAEHSTLAV